MRYSSIRRRAGRVAGWIAVATLVVAVSFPSEAGAMCCLCRDCSDAPFCVDGFPNSLTCSTFCFNNGCLSTVYDSVDSCAGGCDGAPDEPTATESATPTLTPTATLTATATLTPTATPTATATLTPTATESATPTSTPTNSSTASATVTATASDSPTPSATPSDSPTPSATPTDTPTASPSETPSATPTVTVGPALDLAGHVAYYTGGGPVPDADVVLSGTTPGSVMTGADGNYGFVTAGPGNVTIQPQKDGQFNAAVTSFDAVLVLQAVAGQITLTLDQQRAADVTGNGSFSTLDATRILQFQAGILSRFAAADLCQSDWLFAPVPSPTPNQTLVQPVVGGGNCQPGAIILNPFTPPLAGRDFRAILLGDVSGNWAP